MKATLSSGGTLVIEAETDLESYALRRWAKDRIEDDSNKIGSKIIHIGNLVIDTSFDSREQKALDKGKVPPELAAKQ